MLGENRSRKSSAAQGPVVVIFLGPPGCGKGTQSRELSRTIGLAHVSTGELLRRAAHEGSALGQMIHGKISAGELVPDNLVCQLVVARTNQPDCKRGVILDGFPRTVDQANFLCPLLPPRQTLALNLQMSHTVLLQRLMGRLTCPACGEIYNATLGRRAGQGSATTMPHRWKVAAMTLRPRYGSDWPITNGRFSP